MPSPGDDLRATVSITELTGAGAPRLHAAAADRDRSGQQRRARELMAEVPILPDGLHR